MTILEGPASDAAVTELVQGLEPTARRILARYRIPPQDAEDLVQQALVKYLHNRKTVRDPHAWILGTLRNGCLVYWRERRRSLYESVDAAILEAIAEPCQPEQEREALARDLADLVAELPDRCQSVFDLRYRLGCQPKEAARELGYRGSSIYKITERCLAALSRRLLAAESQSLGASAAGLR